MQRKSGLLTALCCLIIALPASAAVLEEIVVTAQKREQNIQDVGISMTAFSGDQVEALGMTNTTEIIQQVLAPATGSPTVPQLQTPEGSFIQDSSEIVDLIGDGADGVG